MQDYKGLKHMFSDTYATSLLRKEKFDAYELQKSEKKIFPGFDYSGSYSDILLTAVEDLSICWGVRKRLLS